MNNDREIKNKLKSHDPWYTSNQIRSSQYRCTRRIIEGRKKFFSEIIFNHLKKNYHPVLLDAGCGDGTNLTLLNNFNKATVYGMDYSPLRTTRAKKNMPDISILQGDLINIPFKEQTFDVILLNHVLEHIPDDEAVLRQLNKSLKRDGLLILGVPNEGCFLAQLRNNILQRSILKKTDHVHYYTEKTMRSLLNSNDWKIIEIRREGFFTPHTLIHNFLSMFDITFSLLNYLMRKFPTQCAGLHYVCVKGDQK